MIYNYNSDNIIQDIVLDDMDNLIEDVVEEYYMLHRYEHLAIYCPSYIARDIINNITLNVKECCVDASNSDVNLLLDDDSNVIVTLAQDGNTIIESMYFNDGTAIASDATLTYVYDRYTTKELEDIAENGDSTLVFGLTYDDEDNFDESTNKDECNCEIHVYVDGVEISEIPIHFISDLLDSLFSE